ncbi:MAG: hypothetical protein PHV59_09690 [Victivallales bacterium]|nr:hypothetical protein [Victivallales bacterium]
MKIFKDNKGKEWEVDVNMFTVKQVRDALGVNIVDLKNEDIITRFKDDIIFVVDVIYVICRKQVEKRNMDEESFAEALLGDGLSNAVDALLDAWVDFFPEATRKRLRASQALAGNVLEKIWSEVDKTLNLME